MVPGLGTQPLLPGGAHHGGGTGNGLWGGCRVSAVVQESCLETGKLAVHMLAMAGLTSQIAKAFEPGYVSTRQL